MERAVEHVHEEGLPSGLLAAGSSTVTVKLPGDVGIEDVYLDRIEMDYERRLTFADGPILFYLPAGETLAVAIESLAGTDVHGAEVATSPCIRRRPPETCFERSEKSRFGRDDPSGCPPSTEGISCPIFLPKAAGCVTIGSSTLRGEREEPALNEENPLRQIMNARSIAWVGASNNPTKMGTVQLLNLKHTHFPGPIYPIHPTEKTVLGLKAYPSAAELPEIPDLAVLVVPTRVAVAVMEDLGKRGIKRAIIVTAGFKEMGENGRKLEQDLVAAAKRYGMRFVGPNCMGVVNAHKRLNTTFFPLFHGPGPVGMASQSGTYVTQVQLYLARRGIAFSQAISVGNEADIDVVDCLSYLGEEEDTRAIILYLESLRRPRQFLEVARRITPIKPVLALYVGGTVAGGRSARSHTGSLAGNDPIYDAVFRQAGVLRVHSIGDLYPFGFTLATQPALKGNRIGIISHSGGPVTSMADACERCGLEVPAFSASLQRGLREFLPSTASGANPVDLTFSMDPRAMVLDIPRRILESGEVDGIIIHGIIGSALRDVMAEQVKEMIDLPLDELAAAEEETLAALAAMPRQYGKPVVCSSFMDRDHDNCTRFLQDHEIPVVSVPERAVHAMACLQQYGRYARRSG